MQVTQFYLSGMMKVWILSEIIDWYGPYFYIGEIPYDEYLNARNSDNPNDVNPFSGFKINNYWYKIGVECK